MTTTDILKAKRQRYHKMLLTLGEAKYKDVIVSAQFGVQHTTELTEKQLDSLIADAQARIDNLKRNTPVRANKQAVRANNDSPQPDDKAIRTWRNKCLQVLTQRGITATPKNWQPVNDELAKKQYQWILTPAQQAQGKVNSKGLYTFNTVDDLKKLFNQLVAIRDAEKKRDAKLKILTQNN